MVKSPSLSSKTVAAQCSLASVSASCSSSWRKRANSGCFREKTNVAVSEGVKPCCTRERERPVRISRTSPHSGLMISVVLPLCAAWRKAPKNLADCWRKFDLDTRSVRRVSLASCSRIHSSSNSSSWVSNMFAILLLAIMVLLLSSYDEKPGQETTGDMVPPRTEDFSRLQNRFALREQVYPGLHPEHILC